MCYLREEQRIDAGTARKDDKRKADDRTDDETELDRLTKDRRPEVHQDVAGDFVVAECNVAEVADLTIRNDHRGYGRAMEFAYIEEK